jgi:ribosomal protein S27AE
VRERGAQPKFEERPMELYSRDTGKFARSRPVVECAQCGERLFVPEWSEFVDARRVRHLWACEACGYAFETTVRLAAA